MVPAIMRFPAGAGVASRILSAMGRGLAAGAVAGLWPAALPAGEAVHDAGGLTVTGVRATAGDGVECPRIRDDTGRLHPVSWLPPQVAIGDRVTVRGSLAVTTSCRGVVLVVEALVGKGDGDAGGGSGGNSGRD